MVNLTKLKGLLKTQFAKERNLNEEPIIFIKKQIINVITAIKMLFCGLKTALLILVICCYKHFLAASIAAA